MLGREERGLPDFTYRRKEGRGKCPHRVLTMGLGTLPAHRVNTFIDTMKKFLEASYLLFQLHTEELYFLFLLLF